ncbi:ABC transporter [Penicillium waksmanii]|uniref:ABC transporter n=1 Tax=Penicillium waksmanii TaxID=69791 RepID=UPI00254793CF|nr:ABC transporter [Penicillium waksmanii]KAJ5966598.1 ABC transporter [Penicillium waksmanii]
MLLPHLRTTLRARPRCPIRLDARRVSSLPLVRIQDGTFYRRYPTDDEQDALTNPPLFPKLNFSLPAKRSSPEESLQHWAIIGPSGRTDLLDILRGLHISIPPTARSYPYLRTDEIAAKDPKLREVGNAIQYIGFSGEGSGAIGGTRGAYLSARYESLREETDWTVEQFLRGQTSLNPMEGEEKGTVRDEKLLEEVITDLRLGALLDMPVANLSNGQTRRARIAKALLKKPELLLLDEPFMGLDPATVRSISGLLLRLADKCSPRLILALRPQDTVPDWITHTMLVGNTHHVLAQGTRLEMNQVLQTWRKLTDPSQAKDKPANLEDKPIFLRAQKDLKAGNLDQELLRDFTTNQTASNRLKQRETPIGGEALIEMDGVRVQYGDKVVLGNWEQNIEKQPKKGLHWRVRRGQRWAILGANGSGKTTLLSLITSDHPQTYSQPIKILGRSRLPEAGKPGISIFELQSRLGHSSPEIHAFFPRQLSIRAALESSFAETFLARPKLDHERDLDVSAALREFKAELDPNAASALSKPPKITDSDLFPKLKTKGQGNPTPYIPDDFDVDYADQVLFGQLTTAQQRIVLFLRALIHKPDIVILDEPFSGLTASQRDKCLSFLENGQSGRPSENLRHQGLSDEQALLLISHVKEEIPDSVRYYMRLPSESNDPSADPLDFRFGVLKSSSNLGDAKTWDVAWSSPTEFKKATRRSFRRASKEEGQTDFSTYEYFTA